MMGEIKQRDDGTHYFQRGVTDYPAIGDPAALITRDELRLIYDISGSDTIDIGHLQQDAAIGAYVNVDDMLSKHFAVLGTTGVGKSSGVALILRQILEARPNLRLFLLDGHNEYARCFGDRALVLNPRNLKLPFWLFNFEEIDRRLLRRPPRRGRGSRDPRRADPAGEEQLHAELPHRRPAVAQAQTTRRPPATRSTRRCPTGSPTSSR